MMANTILQVRSKMNAIRYILTNPPIYGSTEIVNGRVRVDHCRTNVSVAHERLGFMKGYATT